MNEWPINSKDCVRWGDSLGKWTRMSIIGAEMDFVCFTAFSKCLECCLMYNWPSINNFQIKEWLRTLPSLSSQSSKHMNKMFIICDDLCEGKKGYVKETELGEEVVRDSGWAPRKLYFSWETQDKEKPLWADCEDGGGIFKQTIAIDKVPKEGSTGVLLKQKGQCEERIVVRLGVVQSLSWVAGKSPQNRVS